MWCLVPIQMTDINTLLNMYDDGRVDEILVALSGYVPDKSVAVGELVTAAMREGNIEFIKTLKEAQYAVDHMLGSIFIKYLTIGNLKPAMVMIENGLINKDQFISLRNRSYQYSGHDPVVVDDVVARLHFIESKMGIDTSGTPVTEEQR